MTADLRVARALDLARAGLLAARNPAGHWTGELSSSALSTATAVCALAVVQRESGLRSPDFQRLIARGLDWLAYHVNVDGGWGDTTLSLSNLSTTTLVWAAFGAAPDAAKPHSATVAGAERWLARHAGGASPDRLAPAVIARYGKDRTFSVPILTMCALAGRLGAGRAAWQHVIPLPFELAACPHRWFAALRLPVVSYALPALIAIGQARHHHAPSRNPLLRLIRKLTRNRTLRVLAEIQPASGGFLEATPLTSFVVMSLAGSGQVNHPVTSRGVEFLVRSVRADGSWPIDTNLATWLTTLSVNALGAAVFRNFPAAERNAIRDWLLNQQYRTEHPYTHAAPGGWAWTDLPGGVPDADDTAGALLALKALGRTDERTREAAARGVEWLLDLQNRDGGIPTFCRGWGALPFDRSAPDLTAHALGAWLAWEQLLPDAQRPRVKRAVRRALDYLRRTQRPDGAWIPLWFGNQREPREENPTYGTSRVLPGLTTALLNGFHDGVDMHQRGLNWLLSAQRPDGAWSGCADGDPSIEETALAVEALAHAALWPGNTQGKERGRLPGAISTGVDWLAARVEAGRWTQPAPIGFYFARLWYFEKLYPLIFTVGALTRAAESARESAEVAPPGAGDRQAAMKATTTP